MDKDLKERILAIGSWARVSKDLENGRTDTFAGASDGLVVLMQCAKESAEHSWNEEYSLSVVESGRTRNASFSTSRSKELGGGSIYGDADVRDLYTRISRTQCPTTSGGAWRMGGGR